MDRFNMSTETQNVVYNILRAIDKHLEAYIENCSDTECAEEIQYYRGKKDAAYYILKNIKDDFEPLFDE